MQSTRVRDWFIGCADEEIGCTYRGTVTAAKAECTRVYGAGFRGHTLFVDSLEWGRETHERVLGSGKRWQQTA